MTPTQDPVPNPGSREAIMQQCTCPVLDNAHGRGYLGGVKDETGATLFVFREGCPVHVGGGGVGGTEREVRL